MMLIQRTKTSIIRKMMTIFKVLEIINLIQQKYNILKEK